jgi:hypothetical protein
VALEKVGDGADDALRSSFRFELAQSIYTAIATEILVGLVVDAELDEGIRLCAVQQLVRIWERAQVIEIDDFCPMLEAAWRARSRCAARFGTLLATVEYVRLVQEDCPLEFLDQFTSDRVSTDAVQAFEEFLFDLTHEELTRVHGAMRAEGCTAVDAAFVSRVVGRRIPAAVSADDPDALFTSYRRRSAAAAYRRVAATAGPRRVAEAYTMIELLRHRA